MKYAVIAALLATTTSAATGCKPGIVSKVFDKKGCKGEGIVSTKYTSEDISKTGECQHSSPDDTDSGKQDVKILKDAKAKLTKDEKALKDADTKFKTEDDAVKMKSLPTDTAKMPKKIVDEKKYAALEAAYFTKMASEEKFNAYKAKNESLKSKINTYADKQADYYKKLHTTGNTAETTAVVTAKKAADKAFKDIEVKDGKDKDEVNKKNRALIDKYVEDSQKEDDLFEAQAPNVETPSSPMTDEEKLKEANRRALGEYLVRSYAVHKATETVNAQKGVVASFQKTVDD